jgi:hypothetical protein
MNPNPEAIIQYHVFLASPGDVTVERQMVRQSKSGTDARSSQARFACVLATASVSTRINNRYQAENRCRQRHRVRKAVLVQFVRICPKAFADVIRSGQGAIILANIDHGEDAGR